MEFIQTALFSDFLGTPAFFWMAFITIVVGLLVVAVGLGALLVGAIAVALSFGLGGREAAGKLAEHWLSKLRRDP